MNNTEPCAYDYLQRAEMLYEDAQQLLNDSNDDCGSFGARYLIYMAIELALKAYMRHCGLSFEGEKNKDNRTHNLRLLFKKCQEKSNERQNEYFPSLDKIPVRGLNLEAREMEVSHLKETKVIHLLCVDRGKDNLRYPTTKKYHELLKIQILCFVTDTLLAGLLGSEPNGFIHPQLGKEPKYSQRVNKCTEEYKMKYGTRRERDYIFGSQLLASC